MKIIQKFKQTEIGEIPEDWDLVNFGDWVDYSKGFPFKSKDYVENGRRIIRVSDTTFNEIKDGNEIFIEEKEAKNYKKWELKEDDLIFSTVGSKPPMYDSLVGRVVIITPKHQGCLLNQNAVLIRAKNKTKFKQVLLLNNFRTQRYLRYIEAIFRGNANQASITLKELFKFQIAIPKSSEEQSCIASVLSDTDALIESLDKLIAKKKNIKQGTMQELLTGKKRLPGFKGEWENCNFENTWQKLYPKSKLSSGDGDPQGDFILFVSGSENKRIDTLMYQNMEALIFSDGGVFNVRFFKGNFSVTDHCVTLNLNQNNLFYYYWLTLNQQNLDLQTFKGSGLRNLNKKELAKVEVPKPSPEEQSAIASVLSDMDAEIEQLERKRDKVKLLKIGMMQELLTGRIRLK